MNPNKLTKSLRDEEQFKVAGAAFLGRLKGLAKELPSKAKSYAPEMAGAAGLAATEYALSHASKGKKSPYEKATGKAVEKTKGDKGSFKSDLAQLSNQAAGVMKRHPGKAALLIGATAGPKLGRQIAQNLSRK